MMDIMHIHGNTSVAGAEAMRRRLDGMTGLREEVSDDEMEAIRYAAETFESYFIQMMFREMRRSSETLNENSFIPRSQAERIFTEMLDEETAISAAANGGIGLADMIYNQMTRHLQ